MKKLHLLLFVIFTTLSSNLFAQNNQVQFLEKEKGFSTKDSCKIVVKQYYGLSEGRYYFAVDKGTNYFYIDTNEVTSIHNLKIGRNKELATVEHPGRIQKVWLGAVCAGIVLVPVGAIASAFVVYEYGPSNLGLGGPFYSFVGVYTLVWFKVFQDALFEVRLVKAYQTAKPYLCQ
jgi:hypothetical protein